MAKPTLPSENLNDPWNSTPRMSPAYVGLGIVYGMKGDLDQGRALMEKAKTLARNDEQKKEVEMGFERLDYMEDN